MKTMIYDFKIEDSHQVLPQIDQKEYMEEFASYKRVNIRIIGVGNSSLIAINEVANFFDVNADVSYEWYFTASEHILENTLIAVIQAD